MRKVFSIILIMIVMIFITGCEKGDNIKFKEEYESLNGKETGYNDYKYLNVNIDKDNKIKYKTDTEIVEVIKSETAVIYFGFSKCPWCRSMIENLVKVTNKLNIENVYYVDIKDIRDTLEVNDQGQIVRSKSGTGPYMELLTLLNEYLSDYTIKDKDGNIVTTKSKRIYAPNVLVVKKGQVVGLEDGISDKLVNPYDKITEEIQKESYDSLYNLIEKIKPSNTCSSDGAC